MHNVHQSYDEAHALTPDGHEAFAPYLIARRFFCVCCRGVCTAAMIFLWCLLPAPEHGLDKRQPGIHLAQKGQAQAPVHPSEGGRRVHHVLVGGLLGFNVVLGLLNQSHLLR